MKHTAAMMFAAAMCAAVVHGAQAEKRQKPDVGFVKVEWSEAEGAKWAVHGMADREAGRMMATNTVFSIQSNTKTMASVLLLTLVEEGLLGIDDPVSKYIPAFADIKLNGRPPKNKVTLRHLATHLSGLAVYSFRNPGVLADMTSYEDGVRIAVEKGLRCEPGTEYHYCSAAFQILGAVMEKVTGRTVPELMRERIFKPLEMDEATFYPDGKLLSRVAVPYYYPPSGGEPVRYDLTNRMTAPFDNPSRTALLSSGVFCTAGDFLKFSQMLVRKGLGMNGRRILSEETCDRFLFSRQTPPEEKKDTSFDIAFADATRTSGGKGGLFSTVARWNWKKRSCYIFFQAKSPYAPHGAKSELDASGFDGKATRFEVSGITVGTNGVSCLVRNNEDRHGVGTVSLTVNGRAVDSQRVALAIGESQRIDFDWRCRPDDNVEVKASVEKPIAK